jgi:1-acyl-sn-glycerol-3-phosphate acyltransferase
LTYRVINRMFLALFRALGLRIDVVGAEHLPSEGAAIVVCNHTSYVDFAFVGLVARGRRRFIRFMAKREVFDNPVAGALLRRMGHIRVDRSNGVSAYRDGVRALRAGEIVGLFPEATISRSWTLKPFKLGAATLAINEQVPIIPVIVWGAHRIATVDGHFSLRRRTPITVLVGEPLHAAPGATPTAVDFELRQLMEAQLIHAQASYPDRPRYARESWWLPRHLGGSAPTPAAAAVLDAHGLARSTGRYLAWQ